MKHSISLMRHFSIKELERLSGIKAHTIRAWESRYGVFSPQRTDSNIRYYSVEDLRYLLNIAILYKKYRISLLVGIDKNNLDTKVRSIKGLENRQASMINSLVIYMFEEDIDNFERLLDNCLRLWGIDNTLSLIIIPFLHKTDILSYQSSSTSVHFVVTALRKKIIFGIESLTNTFSYSDNALLFLPPEEHFDLVLLYIYYVLKSVGVHVFYLGTNISLDNLEKVVREKKPTLLFSYITSRSFNQKAFSNTIKRDLPDVKLYIFSPFENPEISSTCGNIDFWSLDKIGLLKTLFSSKNCH